MFPGGARFAFTVFDDTDHATVANVKPVYDLLTELGMRTTKSVWLYPSRGTDKGSSTEEPDYRRFVQDLLERGYEIALHGVGDGRFTRQEVLEGFERFRRMFGKYPSIHANHRSNPGNLYWWECRFEWPLRVLYRMLAKTGEAGHDPSSELFWGDIAKRHLRYIRNLTFDDIDTLTRDPRMPYRVDRKAACSNLWFSSSDGQGLRDFNRLIAPENVDRLVKKGGACIVYTHFASGFVRDGRVDRTFEERVHRLADRRGWFVPVSQLLDHLAERNRTVSDPGLAYRLSRELIWLRDRVSKRLRLGR